MTIRNFPISLLIRQGKSANFTIWLVRQLQRQMKNSAKEYKTKFVLEELVKMTERRGATRTEKRDYLKKD
jgi:hypothetical protein